jgi:hypothetical protein
MNQSKSLDLYDSLIWEQGLRLFAMTNLSENNPFRKEIEEQSCRTIEEIFRVTGGIPAKTETSAP